MKTFPWKRVGIGVAIVAAIGGIRLLPLKAWLGPLFESMASSGWSGWLLFVLLGIALVCLFVPVSVPIAAAGAVLGFTKGVAAAGCVLAVGSSIGFGVGRWLWPRIQDADAFRQPIFKAVRQAIETDGYSLLALLRMTPFLHFMTGNLFLGSLNLRFMPYLLFSLLGMVPGTALLVYGGSVARTTLSHKADVSAWEWGLFGLGLLIFVSISLRITRRTRRILHMKTDGQNDHSGPMINCKPS